ncbi:hypothetical protein GYMLUDRAFT_250697 [Collybiopsis luxurians FD-317 M1]|uniref:Spt5 transcription elongation factor N-terminal domain-containing protein n=1 Tax=Collybiopsis luxurians FD-317 M1 TaxID=944289 RepID=A0A0D0BU45_9AGAR|nr:hypothetical protein GYMLUDRAFT_250697 [Collybiopsis luxurians FD-317 M1]
MKNQFIDLEAQVDSKEEPSDDEGDARLNSASFIDNDPQDIPAPASSSTSTSSFSTADPTTRLDIVVERIENRYLNTPHNQEDEEPTNDPTR